MRGNAKGLRPTANDLNEVQLLIYGALPGMELRELYLGSLPDIVSAGLGAKKKAELIRARAQLIEGMIAQFTQHKHHLQQLANDLESGVKAGEVDLRKELAPPEITSVAVRYVRGKRGN